MVAPMLPEIVDVLRTRGREADAAADTYVMPSLCQEPFGILPARWAHDYFLIIVLSRARNAHYSSECQKPAMFSLGRP